MSKRLLAALWAVVMLVAAAPLAAQSVDVIRGRVVGPDSQPVVGARVTVTSIGGNVNRQARTDAQGRYTVTFPGGDGDYMVSIAAIGFSPKRFEIKRTAEQDILIGDAKLAMNANVLDAVEISAGRDRVRRNDAPPDIGGSERAITGNLTNVPADQWGDLAAMAASLPGVSLVPGQDGGANGYSVLGLGADQNNTTLNGLGFGGATLPRDAAVGASLVTSPYDVSRGGFSGGQFQLRTRPGSNFLNRGASLNIDNPALQWTDPAAAATGQQFSNYSLGGLLSGPISIDKAFYNLSYQLGRRAQDFQTLLNTSAVGLQNAGVAPDSVARFLGIVNRFRVPTSLSAIPSSRLADNAAVFGSLDFQPPSSTSGQAFNLTFNASWNANRPLSFGVTEVPAATAERAGWRGGVQGRHSAYLNGILTETSAGYSVSRNEADPYLDLPLARVRVNSVFSDGTAGVSNLSFGGNQFLNSVGTTGTAEVLNQLSWFSNSNKHRLKLTTELRHDALENDIGANLRGVFTFNSLADLEQSRPVIYSREQSRRVQEASQVNGAVSLGDSWRVNPDLQVQMGLRLDGQRFLAGPLENPEVESIYGVGNATRPNAFYLSPRLGFSWAYGQAAQVGAFEGAFRGPRAILRGGLGVFQGVVGTQAIGGALVNTGLPTALQQLTCAGAAVPLPNWAGYLANPGSVPTQCAGGAPPVFSNAAPNVSLFADDFRAPRSLRSNLQWTGPVLDNRFSLSVDATYSRNVQQQGVVDLNVNPTTRFTLADEGGRPIFVRPTSIAPPTGAIAARDALVSQRFNRVSETRGDLLSESRQLTVGVSPLRFGQRFTWSANYVLGWNRDEVYGFQSTVGNPFEVDRARSSFDSRHQIVVNLGYNFFDVVRVNWFSSFRSGTPFTPQVGGDVNGDGYGNDRAFIFDPRGSTNPAGAQALPDPALTAGMQALLDRGSPSARACLRRQLGRLAARNSCEGPWVSQANLSISLNPVKVRLPHRAQLSFQVSNPLGAADLLLHGSDKLKGWGQPVFPDANLLFVRGFDPATQRFRYEVNERFGATNPQQTVFRLPVTVTALMRFDLAPTRERQQLRQTLDRGRSAPGQRIPEQTLRLIYQQGGLPNPIAQVLRQQDTLKLTVPQSDSVATLNRWYAIRLDSIWSPLTSYLGKLPDRYDADEALRRYQRAREASVDLLRRVAPQINGLLSASQKRLLPPFIANFLDDRYLQSIRPGTVSFVTGGLGAGFGGGGGGPVMMGGGGGNMQVIVR